MGLTPQHNPSRERHNDRRGRWPCREGPKAQRLSRRVLEANCLGVHSGSIFLSHEIRASYLPSFASGSFSVHGQDANSTPNLITVL